MTQLRQREDGFTLIELMIAMTLSLVVLFAVLTSLEAFTRQTAQQTRVTDADEQVRQTMDRTVTDLRGASVLLNAGATNLSYYVPESTGFRTNRLCLSSNQLYRTSTTSATAPTSAPSGSCSAGTKVATLKSTSSTAFTYDGASSSSTPTLVKNVGLTISLDSSANGRTGSSVLRASVSRRSSGTLPLKDDDVIVTCDSGGALLTLSAGLPGVAGMSVSYSASSTTVSTTGVVPAQIALPSGITTLLATVTNAAGVTNTISKDVQCGS
jgi:prepilin-type N-terminal cleavage/methylation domain-containing protein